MTSSFGYTGVSNSWIVPSGVTTIHVTLLGASGGSSNDEDAGCRNNGGFGANVSATLSVTPGSTLKITVGGQGFHCEYLLKRCGGFNRGGYGRSYDSCYNGGGGRTEVGQDGVVYMTYHCIKAAPSMNLGKNANKFWGMPRIKPKAAV